MCSTELRHLAFALAHRGLLTHSLIGSLAILNSIAGLAAHTALKPRDFNQAFMSLWRKNDPRVLSVTGSLIPEKSRPVES